VGERERGRVDPEMLLLLQRSMDGFKGGGGKAAARVRNDPRAICAYSVTLK
jgi:hypothetical protein